MTECSICYENYNKSTRKKITCKCNYSACTKCIKTFLLDSTYQDAACCSCKFKWGRKFLFDNLPKSWLNTVYREFREDLLFQRELAVLPDVQPFATAQIQVEEINTQIIAIKENNNTDLFKEKQNRLDRFNSSIYRLQYSYSQRRFGEYQTLENRVHRISLQLEDIELNSHYRTELKREKNSKQKRIAELFDIIKETRSKIIDLKNEKSVYLKSVKDLTAQEKIIKKEIKDLNATKKVYTDYLKNGRYTDPDTDTVPVKNEFIRQCPSSDCRGFLSTVLKCDLCGIWACSDCKEIKGNTRDAPHICNEEILVSVKSMESDTKPCPRCSSMIFRSSGCTTIWCTVCHVFFDFRSGKIHNKVMHNPEYTDYLRNKKGGVVPREPGDILCGREIDQYFLGESMILPGPVRSIIGRILHIKHMEIHHQDNEDVVNHRELIDRMARIDFIRNKITEKQFKVNIQKREKSRQKEEELSNIMNMFVTCATDILYIFRDDFIKEKKDRKCYSELTQEFYTEMNELRVYTNTHLSDIYKMYNSSIKNIDKEYNIVKTIVKKKEIAIEK